MSILIRGMQMPSECRKCFAMDYGTMTGETYCKVNGKTLAESYRPIEFNGRPDWCPLVDLGKHGDLIDAGSLKEEFPKDTDWEYPVNTNEYVCEMIDNAPTVIEAEDGTCTM